MNRYISMLLAGLAVASSTACHEIKEDEESPVRPEIIATKADYTVNFYESFSLSAYLVEPGKEPVTDYLWNMKMTLTGNKWVGEYPVFWMDGQEIEFYAVRSEERR